MVHDSSAAHDAQEVPCYSHDLHTKAELCRCSFRIECSLQGLVKRGVPPTCRPGLYRCRLERADQAGVVAQGFCQGRPGDESLETEGVKQQSGLLTPLLELVGTDVFLDLLL